MTAIYSPQPSTQPSNCSDFDVRLSLSPSPMYNEDEIKVKFPWWAFLNQPVFDSKVKLILNPREFQRTYQVRLLERCLRRNCLMTRYRKYI